MQKTETLTQLQKKLRRNKATILSDEEVDLLAWAMRAMFGAAFAEIPRHLTVRADDIVNEIPGTPYLFPRFE